MTFDQNAYHREWYQQNKERLRKYKRRNMRKYRAANPEKYRKQSREAKARLKEKVFDMYGKECQSCGFDNILALTLDHINNNGAEERKELGERGVYNRSIGKYRPEEYRILCMNCQFIKRVKHNRQNQWLKSHGSG